jgi:hypothetical protein
MNSLRHPLHSGGVTISIFTSPVSAGAKPEKAQSGSSPSTVGPMPVSWNTSGLTQNASAGW